MALNGCLVVVSVVCSILVTKLLWEMIDNRAKLESLVVKWDKGLKYWFRDLFYRFAL